jgi:carbonic anhydrase/acetyltransferase-like protein (isoleucine patch superfamily)
MTVFRLGQHAPDVAAAAFVAEQATLIGRVQLGANSSVWPQAVLRGDNEPIAIGAGCNVQDGAVLHADPGYPLILEANVSVGHLAMLHGCKVGEGSLIGIQAVVMNDAVIGKQCLVGAGAIVTERKSFPDRTLILGAPAKAVRELTDEEVARLLRTAEGYVRRAAAYRQDLAVVR